jgi:hypothetical protein
VLLQDHRLREKIMHFDHERIPERVVHARGAAAHGVFRVYGTAATVTKAAFLAKDTVAYTRIGASERPGRRGCINAARRGSAGVGSAIARAPPTAVAMVCTPTSVRKPHMSQKRSRSAAMPGPPEERKWEDLIEDTRRSPPRVWRKGCRVSGPEPTLPTLAV